MRSFRRQKSHPKSIGNSAKRIRLFMHCRIEIEAIREDGTIEATHSCPLVSKELISESSTSNKSLKVLAEYYW